MQKRLVGNGKYFNMKWKELFCFDAEGVTNLLKPKRDACGRFVKDPDMPAIFLGVELDLKHSQFRWRHAAKRVEKATALQKKL